MNVGKSKLKFCFGLILAIFIYISFMVYYVAANPNEPNNVVIEQKATIQNINCAKPVDMARKVKCAPNKKNTESDSIPNQACEYRIVPEKTIGPEFYLGKITDFYQQIITLLLAIIGIVLAINFYVSKWRSEDIAREALEGKSFGIAIDKIVGTHVAQSSDIADINQRLDEVQKRLNDRLEFLEKTLTEESYKLPENKTLEE